MNNTELIEFVNVNDILNNFLAHFNDGGRYASREQILAAMDAAIDFQSGIATVIEPQNSNRELRGFASRQQIQAMVDAAIAENQTTASVLVTNENIIPAEAPRQERQSQVTLNKLSIDNVVKSITDMTQDLSSPPSQPSPSVIDDNEQRVDELDIIDEAVDQVIDSDDVEEIENLMHVEGVANQNSQSINNWSFMSVANIGLNLIILCVTSVVTLVLVKFMYDEHEILKVFFNVVAVKFQKQWESCYSIFLALMAFAYKTLMRIIH